MKMIYGLLILVLSGAALSARDFSQWQVIRPSGTGIPGDRVTFAATDPAGRLWVGAHDGAGREGGVAIYDGQRWISYTNLNSPLPAAVVHDAAFDGAGAVWLGTGAGLVRFDGAAWQTFGAANSPLPAGDVRQVKLDAAGHLWMLCGPRAGACVAMFDGAEWSVWNAQEIGFAAATGLSSLSVDAAGNLWVGSAPAGGVARYDWIEWTVLDVDDGFSDAAAGSLTLGGDGRLWLDWNGLKRYDGQSWERLPGLPGAGRYTALAVESEARFWVGTESGLLARHADTWQVWECAEPVGSVALDPDGRVWGAGERGVHCVNPDGQPSRFSAANTGLSSAAIGNFSFDAEGRLWVATATGGLCCFDGARWRAYNSQSAPWPFATDRVEDVLAAQDGSVWVALGAHGAARLTAGRWTHYLSYQHVGCLGEDARGRVWLGLVGGAAVCYPHGLEFYGTADGVPGAAVTCIETDRAGNVWLGTQAGLACFDGATWQSDTGPNSGLPYDRVSALAVGPEGDLWVATAAGVTRLDATLGQAFGVPLAGLPAGKITSLACTEAGDLWLGAAADAAWPGTGGVARFDGQGWSGFTTADSPLPSGAVHCVEAGPLGAVWIGTADAGLAVVKSQGPSEGSPAVDLLAMADQRLTFPWGVPDAVAHLSFCTEAAPVHFASRWVEPDPVVAERTTYAMLTRY